MPMNTSRRLTVVFGSLLLAGVTACEPKAAGDGASAAAGECASQEGAEYLCGINNAEKLTRVDGTRWAVASATGGGPTRIPPLYFVNLETRRIAGLDPASIKTDHDSKTFPGCDQPDFATMTSVGMDVRPLSGRNAFYVVNHGGRMTTEVFDIETTGDIPSLTWRGCIQPPDGKWFMDDLAILPDGGIVISNFFDPTDPAFKEKLSSGAPTGGLGVWRPGKGWTQMPIGQVSGPNGVTLSADDRRVFFADYGGNGLARMELATGKIDQVKLGFLVDNLQLDEKGKYVLAGGQNAKVEDVFACLESSTSVNCDIPFSVVAIDPVTLAVTRIHGPAKLGVVGAGTGALQDGDFLWLTTFRSDRLPRIPYPLK